MAHRKHFESQNIRRIDSGFEQRVPSRHTFDSGAAQARPGGFRGVAPRGYRPSDDLLLTRVLPLFSGRTFDASRVTLDIVDGVVMLGGFVASREVRRYAEEQVARVPGVCDVENRLRVAPRHVDT